jgi:hypothetical protein
MPSGPEPTSASPTAAEPAVREGAVDPTLRSDPSPRPDPLGAEIAALDAARAALRAHQPANALAALDSYAQRFPRGMLMPEASVVRIEALIARGDRGQAGQLGRAFLAAHPASPLAVRVRAMLDSVIDPGAAGN